MDDRFNTIAGWLLGGGIVLLGGLLVSGEYYGSDRPETMGYPIAGVEQEGAAGAAPEQPIAAFLQTADAARGQRVFGKCSSCHSINQGGANGIGPNLWATMGVPVSHVAGYAYSDALRGRGGNWDWETMSAWLLSPRAFAAGTKMTFAGLSDPQDRADVMVYLNSQGGSLPLPPPPPAAGGPVGDAAQPGASNAQAPVGDEGPTNANQPVVNEAQAASNPERTGGDAAPGAGTNATDR